MQTYESMNSMRLLAEHEERRKRVTPVLQEALKGFLRNASLYGKKEVELVDNLEAFYPQNILLYCPSCQADRPFHDSVPIGHKTFPSDEKRIFARSGMYSYDYSCTGCSGKFYCWIFVDFRNGSIEKVGQLPSVADLLTGELTKYRKVLGDKYVELNRAVGLYAHGIGIGSFVYLRRIFEGLIDEAYEAAKQDPNWDDGLYQRARMDRKIVLLSGCLPSPHYS